MGFSARKLQNMNIDERKRETVEHGCHKERCGENYFTTTFFTVPLLYFTRLIPFCKVGLCTPESV